MHCTSVCYGSGYFVTSRQDTGNGKPGHGQRRPMKELMLVGIGSFFGGSLRYVISNMIQSHVVIAFPFGTLAVNVLGCLALGLIAVLAGHQLAKLVG